MILRFNQFIAESDTYDNKFVGKSDKTNWSQEDIDFIESVKLEPFTEKEIENIKNLYSERFKEREDLIVEDYWWLCDGFEQVESWLKDRYNTKINKRVYHDVP